MQKDTYRFQEADDALLAAVDEAIERAVETAGHELQSLGVGRSPYDYFADAALRKKKERREDIEKDASEQQQLALSAQNFALKTVIRALVDHARASDPQINDRLNAAIDARHTGLGNVSDTDREFTEKAKAYLSLLTTPPE
ncbi:hypothetical protein ACC676_37985 [Rhizobium ruizarguesonis]|jgi:hypothetical protein|nr:hypothetical protein E0H46_29545 [Rhizobium leguminosarum bv. viciae]TCB10653.1 hypothetical protein E0J18_29415 [Rhizobium leguminosarum bv. viciae]TCB40852.1 hypothetical protein E0J02_18050 [Rhizobium leguminosarum bv. viciae]